MCSKGTRPQLVAMLRDQPSEASSRVPLPSSSAAFSPPSLAGYLPHRPSLHHSGSGRSCHPVERAFLLTRSRGRDSIVLFTVAHLAPQFPHDAYRHHRQPVPLVAHLASDGDAPRRRWCRVRQSTAPRTPRPRIVRATIRGLFSLWLEHTHFTTEDAEEHRAASRRSPNVGDPANWQSGRIRPSGRMSLVWDRESESRAPTVRSPLRVAGDTLMDEPASFSVPLCALCGEPPWRNP